MHYRASTTCDCTDINHVINAAYRYMATHRQYFTWLIGYAILVT
jgi:hypothetical protein